MSLLLILTNLKKLTIYVKFVNGPYATIRLGRWSQPFLLFIYLIFYNYPQFPQTLDAIYGHFKKSTLRPP